MSLIQTTPPEKAEGKLAELYAEVEQALKMALFMNIMLKRTKGLGKFSLFRGTGLTQILRP